MVYPLITLYSPTETEFLTNGLGSLGDATSCIVTEEANGSFELEMVYPVTGRRYKDIENRCIIFAKPNPVDPPQAFRIYEISKPMDGLVTYYAAHISYDLSGYPVKPFTADSCISAFTGLKANSVINHPFNFWTDKEVVSPFTLTTPVSSRTVLGGVQGSILDTYGGEYKFDNFMVRLYVNRGMDRGVTIRYGKNLTDLNQEENCSNVYTGAMPYWESFEGDLVQLPELYIPAEGSYNFTRIMTLDLSTYFDEAPTEAELRERAQKYMKDNKIGTPKVSLTVSFAQLEQTEEYKNLAPLERVELCDTIQVEFPEMAVSSKAKVCETVYDVIRGRYISVTIGEVRSSISDTVIAQEDNMTQMEQQTSSRLQGAINRATNWIVNGKGYMVAVKDDAGNWIEICSLDTPNIDEAINVWRWNNGGFGHSSHGYNGPYDTAITQEGEIVADFITTGTLTATLIQAGVLQSRDGETFYLDIENGVLKMKAKEFQISGKTVDEIADEKATDALNNSKLYSDEILANYANEVSESLNNLQEQVDGQIESYYYDYEPTLFNEPASNWTSTEERKKHEGDLFYDKSSGYAYRFYQEGSTWKWQLIRDTDITKALQTAETAKDTADHKRRTFVVQPEPPYDIGDMWTNGTDILTATASRPLGSAFSMEDWQKLNTYTDDTVANQALEEARKSTNLTIVLDNEYQGIPTDSKGNYEGSLSVSTRVQVYYGHTNITSLCTYTFAKSEGVTGDWKESTQTYTITALTADTGWVDITADYSGIFQVTKRFNVAKVKSGADGTSGSNGIGISGSTVTYQKSGDGTTPPNTWLPDIPSTAAGEYLWTRTVTTYTDGNSTTTYSVSRNGLTGATGAQGTQGINLILESGTEITNANYYAIHEYLLSEPVELNETYTITLWGSLGNGKTDFRAFIGNGSNPFCNLVEIRDGVYKGIAKKTYWYNEEQQQKADHLYIYAIPNSVTNVNSTITKIKMEHGTIDNPIWTPAPQDLVGPQGTQGINLVIPDKCVSYTSYNSNWKVIKNTSTETIMETTIVSSVFYLTLSMANDSDYGWYKPNGICTISGFIKVNDKYPQTNYFIGLASTYGNTLIRNTYDPATGFFVITQIYDENSPGANWIFHAPTTSEASVNDKVTITNLKFEKGNVANPIWTPAPQDLAARTYFIEPTANILKRGADNRVTPPIITAKSYYRDGQEPERTVYAGYWKVEQSTNGTSFSDLGSAYNTTYSSLPVAVGSLDSSIVAIRFTLYSDAAKTKVLDMQTIPVVIDVDNLTHEQIFNLLTNNGEVKGIYQEGNQLYISFTYAKGGELTLGGANNQRGVLNVLDIDGSNCGTWNNEGITMKSGTLKTIGKVTEASLISGELDVTGELTVAGVHYDIKCTFTNNIRMLLNGNVLGIMMGPTIRSGATSGGYAGYSIGTALPYLAFGNATSMYYYINNGSNPLSRTERHVFNGDIYCQGAIRSSGEKTRVVATDSFGEVAMNALETPEPYFSDIGSGTIGENGEISIFFDPIFSETIELASDYQVFLTRTSAKMTEWVEKKQGYFIVHGEPGATFDWMVNCKQKGYSGVRMQEIPTSEFSSVNSDEEVNFIDESDVYYPAQD